MLLREGAYVYDVLERAKLCENADPLTFGKLPRYTQHAARLYGAEISRMREMKQTMERAKARSRQSLKMLNP